jgi:hypothetical protein
MNQSRLVFRWLGGAALLAVLVPGCGGSSFNSMTLGDFSSRLAKLICDRLVGCCNAIALPLDPATCNANATSYFQQEFSKPDPTKVRYDGSAADGCLAAYSAALNGCTFDQGSGQAVDAACDRLLVGQVPLGGACHKGAECAPQPGTQVSCSFTSSNSGSSDEGTCKVETSSPAAAPHGKQGEACTGSCAWTSCTIASSGSAMGPSALCFASEGLYCDEHSTCQPSLADGAACSYSECKQGSYCADRLCAPKKADGTPCTGSEQCLVGHCQYPKDTSGTQTGVCGEASIANADTCSGIFDD